MNDTSSDDELIEHRPSLGVKRAVPNVQINGNSSEEEDARYGAPMAFGDNRSRKCRRRKRHISTDELDKQLAKYKKEGERRAWEKHTKDTGSKLLEIMASQYALVLTKWTEGAN